MSTDQPDIFRLMYWHALGKALGPETRNEPDVNIEITLIDMYNHMYRYQHPECEQGYSDTCYSVLMAARREALH